VLSGIRARFPDTPVVLEARESDIADLAALGVTGVSAPATVDALLGAVASTLA
jgi:hypothetical protein